MILTTAEIKRLREWTKLGYVPEGFYGRFHFMWHWFYTTKVKEPFESLKVIQYGSHYFYYRNKRIAAHIEKNERKFNSKFMGRFK